MPPAPVSIVDFGCGTGSLAVLLALAGYQLRGLDLSDRMVAAATHKAASSGVPIVIEQGDAASPPYAPASCDVVLARHVLWALPDLGAALLRPSGRLILIEGRWSTGAGLAAADCQELLLQHRQEADVKRLDDPTLWGRQINDERYLVLSRR
jgi:SAM-dependent methyltransferase